MSTPEAEPKTQLTFNEAFAELEKLGEKIAKERQEAGLPEVDGVEMTKKDPSSPIPQDISDFVDEFINSLPSTHKE